jgi:uncharacterized protein YqhQ
MKRESEKAQVGGQAVIEGVMMRSPEYMAVAVRKPNGTILLKKESFVSWTKRYKFFSLPLIRGGVVLIESMVLGIRALNFSADVAAREEEPKKKKKSSEKAVQIWIGLTVIIALALGLGLFFFLPLFLTELMNIQNSFGFNLVDGIFRLAIFLLYLFLISQWKEIRRIFEYHGAEHKSIFAFENGRPLTVDGVKEYTTHHPRCGTSFLLVVVLVAVVVFVFLGKPHTWSDRLIRLVFIPIIGGISYEIIRLSGRKGGRTVARFLVAPGLWLQKITTKEPDDSQLEVALVALKGALNEELPAGVESAV